MNNEEKILNLLTQMQDQMNNMQSQMNTMQSDIKSLKENQTSMQSDISEIKNKVTAINDQTADLTEFHTETNFKLNKLSGDLDFLTHKEFQTEKEMFHLKRKLTKQRKSIK
jgi:chromosome segregation ATPase